MVESVAVIIVSFNARARLMRAVASARDAAEIVVVDNASTDGSADAIERAYPYARVLRQAHNEGFGRAANRGVWLAQAPWVLLLNPDATLPSGGPSSLLHAYRRAEHRFGRIGAVAARHLEDTGAWQLSVGPSPSLWGEAVRKWCQDSLDKPGSWRARAAGAALSGILARPRAVAWASASCLLLRRSDFLRIGGFDPAFFLYFEDVDLGLRLGCCGLPTIFDPAVVVTHARGASAASAPAMVRRAYRQGQMLAARRWQRPWAAAAVERFAQWRGRAH